MTKIKKISQSGRFRVAMSMLFIGLLFSSYFIAIFMLSINTFDNIYDAVNDLNILYKKNTCLVNVYLNYRMEVLMNIPS